MWGLYWDRVWRGIVYHLARKRQTWSSRDCRVEERERVGPSPRPRALRLAFDAERADRTRIPGRERLRNKNSAVNSLLKVLECKMSRNLHLLWSES